MRSKSLTTTIAINETASAGRLVASIQIASIQFPAAWTGTDPTVKIQIVAESNMQVAADLPAESDWTDAVTENGEVITIRVHTGKTVVLTGVALAAMAAAHWVRFVASASQGAARTITINGVMAG